MGFGMGGFDAAFGGVDTGFRVMSRLVPAVFLLILGVFLFFLVRGLLEWNRNNRAPRQKLSAQIVSRRTEVTSHCSGGSGPQNSSASTWYYVTFQLENGERMEFSLSGRAYGLLAEGDRGFLTFQGTRYLSFDRT